MRIIDELYGIIDIPDYLTPIVNSPELQRLRDVRLINMFSTSLASLSDIRRLTHTLGVTGLFLRLKPRFLKLANFDNDFCRTMEVACLVHDIATPAFAHLFEWELRRKTGWNHETQCELIVKGHYSRQDIYHQIYFKNQLSLNQRIRDLGVEPENVWQIIKGDGQFGRLLCGTIDLDNISIQLLAVADSSGNDHDGLAAQDTDAISVAGKVNKAFDFNGSSDYGEIGDHDDFTSVKSISVYLLNA